MPCKDITDIIAITVAHDDRVIDYMLNKKTCGGTVGEDKLIGPWLFKRTAAQVMATSNEDFLLKLRAKSDLTEYLSVKHFLAVRTALRVMTGELAGGVDDYCTVESVMHGPDGVEVVAHLDVKGMTDEIQACKNCCGSKTNESAGEQPESFSV